MQTRIARPARFELRHRCPDNLILVENYFNEVVIRAARDNFSARRKLFFIRHLAAEGYIPARYQRLAEFGQERLTWLIDRTWLERSATIRSEANRFMYGLVFSGALLWLVLIGALFLGTR
jgi:hypothetical protein